MGNGKALDCHMKNCQGFLHCWLFFFLPSGTVKENGQIPMETITMATLSMRNDMVMVFTHGQMAMHTKEALQMTTEMERFVSSELKDIRFPPLPFSWHSFLLLISAQGVFKFSSGAVYEGEFRYGHFDGRGTYSFGTGMYDGLWKAGKYHGHGFLLKADGSSFTGNFEEGVQHGKGEENRADGSVVTGFWTRGTPPAS
jgi:hypothetical protein